MRGVPASRNNSFQQNVNQAGGRVDPRVSRSGGRRCMSLRIGVRIWMWMWIRLSACKRIVPWDVVKECWCLSFVFVLAMGGDICLGMGIGMVADVCLERGYARAIHMAKNCVFMFVRGVRCKLPLPRGEP